MMSLPYFELYTPSNLRDAVTFLGKDPSNTKILAGGTDLVPSMKQRLFEPKYLLDIKSIAELHGMEWRNNVLHIGAATTITDIAQNPIIRSDFPVLQQAAATVAGPGLRNVGTIGGNLCLDTRCYWYNQSFFWRQACGFCIKKDGVLCHVAPGSKQCWAVYSGDTAAALLTTGASIKLVSSSGERVLSLSDFFVNDGAIKTRILPGEILSEILIPDHNRSHEGFYEKFRLRGSVDYPLAGVAVSVRKENGKVEDLQVALTAVNPLPVALSGNLAAIANQDGAEAISRIAMRTAKPLKTSASTMDYRRHMVGVIVRRALQNIGL